ncbi:hypothetical protein T310_10018 [Rasamsonia emersonii CBS 393.64]|uniref:DDE-1 domain-containing protein n=1 Tax=Rasamsonia emersonii (strain ATCC 16479 / CBS 393.64 / IMI 116815) TaxID=1408163 RepID=A0A0F4YEN6_RASE3|nr:hypothetical protein T310_10018 [Rasamsonia emersonii CBS 393.64]KKA16411.1 hypothetical protein T310_10018 [Rasamsonia emersonii CBS 393.64]
MSSARGAEVAQLCFCSFGLPFSFSIVRNSKVASKASCLGKFFSSCSSPSAGTLPLLMQTLLKSGPEKGPADYSLNGVPGPHVDDDRKLNNHIVFVNIRRAREEQNGAVLAESMMQRRVSTFNHQGKRLVLTEMHIVQTRFISGLEDDHDIVLKYRVKRLTNKVKEETDLMMSVPDGAQHGRIDLDARHDDDEYFDCLMQQHFAANGRIVVLTILTDHGRINKEEDKERGVDSAYATATIGEKWVDRFIKRHNELCSKYTRKYDYQRAKCEDPELIKGWFKRFHDTIQKYGILEQDIYNMDETGFQMGVISTAKVICGSETQESHAKAIRPGNREWVTAIVAVNAAGWALPPHIILAAENYQSQWYQAIPKDYRISVSKNGWTNDEIGLEWLQKTFETYTASYTVGRYRLLILDGHSSHATAGFDKFCTEKNIIPLYMPSHSSPCSTA